MAGRRVVREREAWHRVTARVKSCRPTGPHCKNSGLATQGGWLHERAAGRPDIGPDGSRAVPGESGHPAGVEGWEGAGAAVVKAGRQVKPRLRSGQGG